MKICLCGSTRFKDRYQEVNLFLSKAGHIVYSVAGFGHAGDSLSPEEKTVLDLVHLRKILESDAILVVGEVSPGVAYVGESTRREIQWASLNDRAVYGESDIFDLCSGKSPFRDYRLIKWESR